MREVTYMSLAQDYANWLNHSMMLGCNYSGMVGVAQTVCEFAMKQIIDSNLCNVTPIMSSHNLRDIYRYITESLGYDLKPIMLEVNTLSNYFYNTRYPSKDAFFAEPQEVENAVKAALKCLHYIKGLCESNVPEQVTL